MEQTIELIRKEIERLHEEYRGKKGDSDVRKALRTVLFFIDTLPEKSVSDVKIDDSSISCNAKLCSAHSECKYYNPNKESNVNHCIGGIPLQLRRMKEEPVSKDLEEAAEKYVDNWYKIHNLDKDSYPIDVEISKTDFKAGAQWQKKELCNGKYKE